MKNWYLLLFILPFMVSCSNDEAEKIADEFHTRLVSEDYDYIIENLTDGTTSSAEEWGDFFEIVRGWGKQNNRINTSNYNFKTTNGVTTVKLSYTFETDEFDLMYERLILIDRGDGYKLLTVIMDTDESVVIEGTKNF